MAKKAKKGRSLLRKVVTGVAIGAAAAATASMLSKRENRQKLVKTLKAYKEKGKKIVKGKS